MQTDTWLNKASYPNRCPLCSQPLKANSNICPSCGFKAHESVRTSASSVQQFASERPARQPDPITPIPARASALRAHQNGSRNDPQRAAHSQAEGVPGSWLHHSSNYEAVSSLSSLSLIISETPTAPPRPTQRLPHEIGALKHIDEIDTLPPPASRPKPVSSGNSEPLDPPGLVSLRLDDLEAVSRAVVIAQPTLASETPVDIEEIDTVPERRERSSRALVPTRRDEHALAVDAAAWTTSSVVTASEADRLRVARSRNQKRRSQPAFHVLDRLRWWLLRPGHIEFLLWLSGSILLFSITFLLLLATVLSVAQPGTQSRGNIPNSAVTGSTGGATSSNTAMHLALSDSSKLLPGSEFQLRGQGFVPRGQVTFLLDGHWPLLNQAGQAASAQVDAAGDFAVTLWLGRGADWAAGPHQIMVNEVGTGHWAATPLTIVAEPATSTSQQANNPANQPTAPVRPSPTPVHTVPTPVSSEPASVPPTPPVRPTSVSTPTPAVTPTPAATSVASPRPDITPTQGSTTGSPDLGNSLSTSDSTTLLGRLTHLNPLVWLIVGCYFLSMVFLGLAGILRYRCPAKRE